MPTHKLLMLAGDGIGPEVMAEVKKLVAWMNAHGMGTFESEDGLVGGSAYRRRDTVRGEDDVRAFRHGVDGIDEDRAALLELVHDVRVVDDLLADVDGLAVERKGTLDRLDSPLDAGAVAAW